MVSGEAFHTRSPFSFDDVQRLKKKNEFQICRNVKDYTLLIVHQFLLIWKIDLKKKIFIYGRFFIKEDGEYLM